MRKLELVIKINASKDFYDNVWPEFKESYIEEINHLNDSSKEIDDPTTFNLSYMVGCEQ